MQPAQSAALLQRKAALLYTMLATCCCNMRVLAAITLLAGASALVPPSQRRSGVALRAGFGAATKKSKAKFVKPGKGQCINQILAARLRHC